MATEADTLADALADNLVLAALILTNVLWASIYFLSTTKPKSKLSGKYSDRDWERALDEKEAVSVKDAMPAMHNEATELFVPYTKYKKYPMEEMQARATSFYEEMNCRRTVREYSSEPFPIEIVEECVKTAGTAPSGAHLQPWTYVIVSDPQVKSGIRAAVEDEEAVNYARRMKESWKTDLAPLGTDANKPYLEIAPFLVCIFKHTYRFDDDGDRLAVYYPEQSVGISVGMFQAALHKAGLVTLTSTPMGAESAIRELCGRPENERLYLLMPVGFPAKDVTIPNLERRPLAEICATV